jgi:hypothetical protein
VNEKPKTHKKLPKQFTLTINQHDLDMLESAVCQLASREPAWRAAVRKFASQCQMERTLKVLDSIKQTEADRQLVFDLSASTNG